ncbi:outer membrane beta-barrel family protein [Epilithonimonas hungarica]|uniref:Outer membrane receptor proteins, mostly Fe transport n=1 Tax=Epilithonimonas hungarica TaxID=454006 RepID=A0A1G7FWB0_9FLAO|nr:outer membrane beta-barrel family protein [Epilithonimonas hungarica]SDE80193.1 Outer membrane receptor proteins, mostly Fe transport [Epilithonimonas hungarica]
MKAKILIAVIFFSGMISAQQTQKKTEEIKTIEEVKLSKKVFVKKSDRFVYDVASSPVAKGTNSFNLLQQTPMLSSTDGKTFKIMGKSNVVFYINGKRTLMDAEAITEMLKNTPSENIQRIEVVTVPGSEFQVEANEGVVNIVMKKSKTNGYNGTLKMNNSQSFYNNPSSGIAFNLRQNKWSFNSNFNMGSYREREKYTLSNGDATFRNDSYGTMDDPNKNYGGSINIDYEINKNQNLGFSYNMRYNKSFGSVLDMTNFENGILSNRTVNQEDAQTRNHNFNLNYEIKTDTLGSKLTSNISYLWFNRDKVSLGETFPLSNIASYSAFKQAVPQIINNYAANIDYIKKFRNESTFAIGTSYNFTNTDSDTRQDDFVGNSFVNNTNLSNHFIYKENIIGAYATYERKFSEKFTGKIGTRLEATISSGDVVGKPDIGFERNYNNLLPYATLNYAINENHNITYSFSSRVRRPGFGQLNPSRTYFTPTNYIQNNPFMQASRNYNQEINYMYKNAFYANVSFNFAENAYSQLPLQGKMINNATGEETKFLRYIRTNYGNNKQLGLTLGMNKAWFGDIWTTNYSANFEYATYKGSVTKDPTSQPIEGFTEILQPYTINVKTLNMFFQTNNMLRLSAKKDWYLGINYWIMPSREMEIGKLHTQQSFDVNIKKIMGNFTFLVELNDVFNQNIDDIRTIQNNGSFNTVRSFQYRREFNVNVTYNFGNQKLKKAREVKSANDAIRSRT